MSHSRARTTRRRATSVTVAVGAAMVACLGLTTSAQAVDDSNEAPAQIISSETVTSNESVSGPAVTAETSKVGVTVSADGWVHYDSSLSTVGATGTTTTVVGVRDADGACTYSGSGSAAAGDKRATYTEEVAYNPATCESTLLTAPVTDAQLATLTGVTGEVSRSTTSSLAPIASTDPVTTSRTFSSTTLATTVYQRYLKTSWIDPINITISTQKAGLRWTSTSWRNWAVSRDSFKGCIGGVCLDKTYIVSSSAPFGSVTGGWKITGNVHFRNTSFAKWVVAVLGPTGWAACGFPTSSQADFYHKDAVTGKKTGASSWSWSDSKSGACTNLVHHGDATGASYPF
ncbi:hypothetical protein [Cellulomonas sp.]|uniref:hypothetical protein n=1 Tax=Cellulomonas sp. TaxID=40001 RepID=UPI001B049D7B|nr:hypothetical protein [Cellulomonas sp.]MBO9556024.1 hypothetical protein [Cellulomonas sp.]